MEIREIEIPDYGILKVSEYGDIWGIHDYSKKRKANLDEDGYYRLNIKYKKPHLNKKGEICSYGALFVHRLVAMAFLSNPNHYPVINHKDGNKQNNHYSNLEWCTVKYNNLHAIKTGLAKGIEGEKNPKGKLTKEQVIEIRELYEKSEVKGYKFYESICKDYGVDRETIRHICKKITWKNI